MEMRHIGIFNNKVPQTEEDLDRCHLSPIPHFMGSEYRELKELTPNYVVMKKPDILAMLQEPNLSKTIPLQSIKFNLIQTVFDEENCIAYGLYLEQV
jgi:hypothetical protein